MTSKISERASAPGITVSHPIFFFSFLLRVVGGGEEIFTSRFAEPFVRPKMTRWPRSFPELIGGTPSLKMNHGSGTVVLQLANNIGVADRRWHRLDVRSNSKVREMLSFFFFVSFVSFCFLSPPAAREQNPSRRGGTFTHVRALPRLTRRRPPLSRSDLQEVRFTLDRCSSAIIMETEGVDSWVMTEDRSSCEIRGVTPNRDK